MDEKRPASLYELKVIIRDPVRLVYSGIATSVTANNKKGIFDILGVHENFITIIRDKVTIRGKEQTVDYPVTQGILKVEENIVNIFLGTETI